MSTLAVLKAARERIAKPGAWCREAFAREHDGRATVPRADGACAWCAVGAIEVETDGANTASAAAVHALMPHLDGPQAMHSVALFNDRPDRTQAQVVFLFDRAIARLEAGDHD